MLSDSVKAVKLPKWPAFLVTGKKVTEDQAIEILFRTQPFVSTNDDAFLEYVKDSIRRKLGDRFVPDYPYSIFPREAFDNIREVYFIGNHRIAASYIGGPHGWCDWDGTIFSNSTNIGKWPSVEGVYREWSVVAEAFPFLSLRCQLLDGEWVEEGERKALVEFRVEGGKVEAFIPEDTKPMISPAGFDALGACLGFDVRGEHIPEYLFDQYFDRFLTLRGKQKAP